MLQNLLVAENLFVDHQRMPIEIKSLELGVIIVVTVSRLSSTSSSFEGNSRDLQQKTWKEVVGVALKEEAAILISFALSHKMMIVITSHTRFHSFTRKGISSLGALEGDESVENSSFKLLSQTSESNENLHTNNRLAVTQQRNKYCVIYTLLAIPQQIPELRNLCASPFTIHIHSLVTLTSLLFFGAQSTIQLIICQQIASFWTERSFCSAWTFN